MTGRMISRGATSEIWRYLQLFNFKQSFCDGDKMNKKYNTLDSYNYFKSGSVGKILHFVIHDRVILKSEVRQWWYAWLGTVRRVAM